MFRGAWLPIAMPGVRTVRALLLASVVTSLLGACGGGAKPSETPKTAARPDKPLPGFPSKGDEGWCDPMPDLGNSCKNELKECMIVCDYISDTCAMLVCMAGVWDYVERGEDSNAGDE